MSMMMMMVMMMMVMMMMMMMMMMIVALIKWFYPDCLDLVVNFDNPNRPNEVVLPLSS